jgi:hypothetical protein
MAGNSDLSRFAVFVNSKSAVYPSSTKSDVVIPFASNLANHDPLKMMKISIVDVLFSNVFYNVRPLVNKLKVLNTFSAGRNKPASYLVREIVFEEGFYNYDSFVDKLNEVLTIYSTTSGVWEALQVDGIVGTQYTPMGFGSTTTGVSPTSNTPPAAYSLTTGKVWFQTPTLADYQQNFLSDESVNILSGTPYSGTDHSWVFSGIYLIVDDETYGLMHLLGYTTVNVDNPPAIPGTPFYGFGYPLYSRDNAGSTQYSWDGVLWSGDGGGNNIYQKLIPRDISDFTGLDELYIHCEQFRTQFLSSISKAPLAPNDVVCVVPINVAFGEKMSFIPNFPLESYLINTNVTQLHFRMTNSSNVEVNFHGINWSMGLFCEEVEDQARIDAETQPVGNLPNTFFISQQNEQAGQYMEQRLNQKRRHISNGLNR